MTKLSQIVAVEKSAKARSEATITQNYHLIQKPVLFDGLVRTYTPKDELGDKLPEERQVIQANLDTVIEEVAESLTQFFDVIATKDWGNTVAKADVKLEDGTVVLEQVPVTYLLFLEKQLVNVRSFLAKLPTLSPTEDWTWDENTAAYRSKESGSTRSKKVPKAHVLYEATPEHPAQVEVFTEDEIVGTWKVVKFSGAYPATKVRTLLDRVEALQEAVKFAREEANSTTVEQVKVGKAVFDYLFAPTE